MAAYVEAPALPDDHFSRAEFTQGQKISFKFVDAATDAAGLVGMPLSRFMFFDEPAGRIGVPLYKVSLDESGVAEDKVCPEAFAGTLLVAYALATTASNTLPRRYARAAYAAAVRSSFGGVAARGLDKLSYFDGTEEEWLEIEPHAVNLAVNGRDAYPITTPAVRNSAEPMLHDSEVFNYRAFRLNVDAYCFLNRPLEEGVVKGTNDQVTLDMTTFPNTVIMWVNVYHSGNSRGFHSDTIAALGERLLVDADAKRRVHLACLLADVHAWRIHQYCEAPDEQSLDMTPALQRAITPSRAVTSTPEASDESPMDIAASSPCA